MMPSVRQCYDGLANEYHLMFADWRVEVVRQGEVLDRLIRCQVGPSARTVLDCACGIGTQAIGLATRGYTVSATDLSPAAVARAAREAASFGVSMTFKVADFRAPDTKVTGTFDVVLCCDNTLAHLLEDADLRVATAQMWARLTPGGLLLASIRDYDQFVGPSATTGLPSVPGLPGLYGQPLPWRHRGTMPEVFDDADGRRIAFQVWDWAADGRSYSFTQFFLREVGGAYQTTEHVSQLRALLRGELGRIIRDTGFSEDWYRSIMKLWHDHDDHTYDAFFAWEPSLRDETILFGAPARVREQLARLLEVSGCNYVIGAFAWGSLSHAQALDSLRLFTEEVMPAFS